eukprot:690569-Pelagomonas_calceolata.AAC.1
MSAEYADLDIVQLTYDQDMRQETADDNEHASALIPVVRVLANVHCQRSGGTTLRPASATRSDAHHFPFSCTG